MKKTFNFLSNNFFTFNIFGQVRFSKRVIYSGTTRFFKGLLR